MKRDLVWLIAVVVAAGAGYWARDAREPERHQRAGSARTVPARPSRSPATTGPRKDRTTESNSTPSASGATPSTGARPDSAREIWEKKVGRSPSDREWQRILEEAATQRLRLEKAANEAEIAAAYRIAEAWLKEQRLIDDAARGGTMALLESLRKNPAHLTSLAADAGAFAKHFERKSDGPRMNGTALQADDKIADGAQIEFPAGLHSLDTRTLFGARRPFPKDLLITGISMDQTRVRLTQNFRAGSDIVSLTFRDLTLDCNSNYMLQLYGRRAATIRMERCRVIGFDMGAGGSNMFAGSAGGFYATDCRFEAGYSRARAGFGNLFDVRGGALLVRMENCVINGPFSSIYDHNDRETFHFVNCEIRDVERKLKRWKTNSADGVTFESCRFVAIEGDARNLKRSLSDINPDWPKRTR